MTAQAIILGIANGNKKELEQLAKSLSQAEIQSLEALQSRLKNQFEK